MPSFDFVAAMDWLSQCIPMHMLDEACFVVGVTVNSNKYSTVCLLASSITRTLSPGKSSQPNTSLGPTVQCFSPSITLVHLQTIHHPLLYHVTQ